MELKPFQEIMIDSPNVAVLKEKLSAMSDIPVENIEISLLKGSFPFEVSVLSVHTELEWSTSITDWPFTMYDDGSGFLFRCVNYYFFHSYNLFSCKKKCKGNISSSNSCRKNWKNFNRSKSKFNLNN